MTQAPAPPQRIVHFGKHYAPDVGGIESVTVSLAEGAAKCGHVVDVVCFDKAAGTPSGWRNGVQVHRLPILKTIASQPLGLRYVLACRHMARQADVIHVHLPNMVAALCGSLFKGSALLVAHWHSDVVKKGLLGFLSKPLEHWILRRADCVLVATQNYADSSLPLRLYRDKLLVIPYGTPDPVEACVRQDDDQLPPLPISLDILVRDKRLILALGRLVPYKGFDVLVDAARYLPEEALVLIGGEGPQKSGLQHAIAQAGVGDRVHLAGRLDASVLKALQARATLFCLPSVERSEAFGVVLLEAMACGLPVVTTEIPGSGVPWVNEHGVSGWNVPVRDPIGLAAACRHILASPTERERLAEGARKRYLREFTEDNFVQRVLAMYSRVRAQTSGQSGSAQPTP